MTKPQGFLATFRIDEELWGKFKDIAKNKQTNASALIIQYIQGVVSSGGVDNPPKATPPNIDISPQPNLDDIYKYIDKKLDNLEDVSIQDIDNKIAESLEDGDIKDAISNSYEAMMAQFNGLLEELQELKKQFEQLKSIPPVPVPQSPITEELTTDNEELTIDNEQLTTPGETGDGQFTEDVESDRNDSDLTSDTQSPMTNQQSPLWDKVLMKNPVDSIRKQLKKKDITKTAEEIKQAFLNAGFDGNNHQSLREDVIKTLSQE